MKIDKFRFTVAPAIFRRAIMVGAMASMALGLGACGGHRLGDGPSARARSEVTGAPGTLGAMPSDTAAVEGAIRFLEHRVKADPEDHIAYNKLGGYYLQRLRETGSLTYLELASKAANASLSVLPPEHNSDGLTILAQVEYAEHDFAGARDHARRLAELDPGKSYPFHTLGDALLELGDYDGAAAAFSQMERLAAGMEGLTSVAIDQRLARYDALRGDVDQAQRRLSRALNSALKQQAPSRETVAWCYWQLGELAFSIGNYEAAEQYYQDALTTFPDYFRAVASLGRVRAARGDLADAIKQYERAVQIVPDPTFVAALGDLYKIAGRDRDAAGQYDLVRQIGRLSKINGVIYNRALAMFMADHDLNVEEAYENAHREFEVRKDVYGADAVAWTALKAGKLDEAQAAIKEALKLGTKDARIWYHAGMIARAAGNATGARDYLRRSLELNPQFDPLQARAAKTALESQA
jgi:tetratricopeptide (TPR) repeat protein